MSPCFEGKPRLNAIVLDCTEITFLPDRMADKLPLSSGISAIRTGGIDLDKPPSPASVCDAHEKDVGDHMRLSFAPF